MEVESNNLAVTAARISSPESGDIEDGEVVDEPAGPNSGRAVNAENLEDGEVSEEEGGEQKEEGEETEADKSESAKKESVPRRSNRVCLYFLQGRCYKGNNCPMIHSTEPANMPMNMGPRGPGPMHPAAAMMMMAAMRGSSGPFMRPPLLPGANIQTAVPPLLQAPGRFPFPFPFKQTPQTNELDNQGGGGQYAIKPVIPGETDQENSEKPEADAGGVSSAWEVGLKRAKELRKQAEIRRKLSLEVPTGKPSEKAATEASAWPSDGGRASASEPAAAANGGDGAKKQVVSSGKRDAAGQERKAFRMNQDGDGGIVDPWRRGAAGPAAGPHRSRQRTRRSASGSESVSGSSASSRSYSSGSGSSSSRSKSGSSASGSSATGSSFSGSGSASGSYSGSGSRSGSSGSSYSSYSGSSYSGSTRSRSRSPVQRRGDKKSKQQHQRGKPQIPLKSRAQGGAGKASRASPAAASKHPAKAATRPAPGGAKTAPSQPGATKAAPPNVKTTQPAAQPTPKPSTGAAVSKPSAAPAQVPAVVTVTAKPAAQAQPAGKTPAQPTAKRPAAEGAAGSAPAAKAAKLSKDDIMRQIAKLDAAIAKKRTTKK